MVMFKNLSYLPLNLLQNKREIKWGKGAWATPNTSAHKAPSHPATRYAWCVTDSQIRDGEISSGSSSTSQDWKLELQKGQNSNWSPKSRNLPALAAAQLEFSGQRCCGETLQQLTYLSFRFETLSLHLVYDLWICSSSLAQLLGTDRSDQEDECFLPGGTFPDDLTPEAKHTCRQEGAS